MSAFDLVAKETNLLFNYFNAIKSGVKWVDTSVHCINYSILLSFILVLIPFPLFIIIWNEVSKVDKNSSETDLFEGTEHKILLIIHVIWTLWDTI